MPGVQILAAVVSPSSREPGPLVLREMWRRPVPVVAAVLVALMAALALAQTVFPALVGQLERDPAGPWWRVLTALLVQSSDWIQIIFNLAALTVVAAVAERVLAPRAPWASTSSAVWRHTR